MFPAFEEEETLAGSKPKEKLAGTTCLASRRKRASMGVRFISSDDGERRPEISHGPGGLWWRISL